MTINTLNVFIAKAENINDDIEDLDSYKSGHFLQYPEGTSRLFAYLESRGGDYRRTTFFGLQMILPQLETRVTMEQVREMEILMIAHGLPFPKEGWQYIAHELKGKLPIRIRAVPEGTVVPVRNALMTVESTDDKVPWVTTWVETQLMRVWHPITVCTRSFHCVEVVGEFLKETADNPASEIDYKVHDFGSRGATCREAARNGGVAHLVNSKGTDTVTALRHAHKHYGPLADMPGYSIPASEHSTVTIYGRDGEKQAFSRMIDQHPESHYPLLANVSDSYDIFHAVEHIWADALLDKVKQSGKTIIIRPDSGDPTEVTLKLLEILQRKVGMNINSKGYKVLPKYFRLIWPDGNKNEGDLRKILQAMKLAGFSASNIAFGIGAGLHQLLSRDTCMFGYKTTAAKVNGEWVDIKKKPITDPFKVSKSGRLDLIKENGEFMTVVIPAGQDHMRQSELVTVFENGEIKKRWTFDEVRARTQRELLV